MAEDITLVTEICNMALGRIGSNRLEYTGTAETDLDSNTTLEAIQCNLNYHPTRKSLLRSFEWSFASDRATLPLDTETPLFEWDYQFKLPNDFWRLKGTYEPDDFTIEGRLLLTNDETVQIKYVKDVKDPKDFTDPLFVEILVLQLALKLIPPLAGTQSTALRQDLKQDLYILMPKAKMINLQEINTTGETTWNNARFT